MIRAAPARRSRNWCRRAACGRYRRRSRPLRSRCASRIAERPTPKQAQITGPVSAIPSPLRPDSRMRAVALGHNYRLRTANAPRPIAAARAPVRRKYSRRVGRSGTRRCGRARAADRHIRRARALRASAGAQDRARQSGGSLVANKSPSPPGDRDARKPRPGRQRDRVARQRKAPIGELDRFDARRRGLQLGLAGKWIVRRRDQSPMRACAAVASLQ